MPHGALSKETRGHGFQGDVYSGRGDCGLARTALGDQHSGEEEHFSGSVESSRSGPSHRVVSSSPGV